MQTDLTCGGAMGSRPAQWKSPWCTRSAAEVLMGLLWDLAFQMHRSRAAAAGADVALWESTGPRGGKGNRRSRTHPMGSDTP